MIVNNTIVRNDSNGILLDGNSPAVIMNNIIALNGSKSGPRRGRGICDFSTSDTTIQYNLFFRNEIAAILADGTDFKKITKAQNRVTTLAGNVDGNPRFRKIRQGTLKRRSKAKNRGNPETQYNDLNDSRNDIGLTGGPDALS